MKTILVTGGAGFIGSHFVEFCLRESDLKIIIVDNLTYAGKLNNIAHLLNESRIEFFRLDITDEKAISELVINYDFDFVVNFAAESHVDRSISDSSIFVHSNIVGVQTLLSVFMRKWSLSKDWKSKFRFIQISTDEVYGSLLDHGQFTENSPISPNNPYSATKASADLLCMSYYKTYGFPVTITRSSNNYGPRQDTEKLIPKTINNAINKSTIPVYGDGRNIRDWIYVVDNCRAIFKLLSNAQAGEIYNIGGNFELTNIEVIKTILEEVIADYGLIEFVKDRPGHDYRYSINDGKLIKLIGNYRFTNFKEGIKLTILYYSNNPS